MLAVVNQPHAEGFRVEGLIPQGILDFIEKNYSKESVSIMEDDEDLLDPHEQKWFREAEEADAPGIDGLVYFNGDFCEVGSVYAVKITGYDGYDLIGEKV